MLLNQYVINVILIKVGVLLTVSYGQRPCSPGRGVCIDIHECQSARNSVRTFGSHSFQRCGWNKLIEKVCCTDYHQLDSMLSIDHSSTTSDEDISIWSDEDDSTEVTSPTIDLTPTPTPTPTNRTSPTESRDIVRKSEAACSRYSVGIAVKINWHIYGGEDAQAGEFPHMVALGYTDLDADEDSSNTAPLLWNCAGSLISDRFVLTAAHCVARTKPLMVRVGALTLSDRAAVGGRQDFNIENITIHSQYVRRTGQNDIALVRISAAVTFNDNVYPACLYTKSEAPLGLLITGWGKLYLGQDTRSDILQKARVSAIPMDQCNATYVRRLNRSLGSGQLCAGPADQSHPSDSCPGDSGGPLQVFMPENIYAVVGVISFGITDCGGDSPSVYTRVYHYLDWIEPIVWP